MLLAMKYLHLDELHVKLLFTNGTLCLLMLYLAFYIATEYFEVRSLLLFSFLADRSNFCVVHLWVILE